MARREVLREIHQEVDSRHGRTQTSESSAARQLRTAQNPFRIARTSMGKGVFATRSFEIGEVVGEITGEAIDDPEYSSRYAFDLEDGRQLEPAPPFRFVNHSCDPNCSFEVIDVTDVRRVTRRQLMLFAIYDIDTGDQLTIDYNWPASFAIPCKCRSEYCRGWVVGEEHMPSEKDVESNLDPS
jgi:uncharacterized protein